MTRETAGERTHLDWYVEESENPRVAKNFRHFLTYYEGEIYRDDERRITHEYTEYPVDPHIDPSPFRPRPSVNIHEFS